jgi:azurin
MLFASCGNNNNSTSSERQATENTETVAAPEVIPTGDTINVVLQSDDNMKFDKTEIRVQLGQTIKLTLKHIGTMPKTAMGHNFVLLKQGVDITEFGNSAAQAKAPDYDIPYNLQKNVIANTKMIGGGESVTIEFLTPPKGSYHFLCSFPGHYGMMKGVFIVE